MILGKRESVGHHSGSVIVEVAMMLRSGQGLGVKEAFPLEIQEAEPA